MTKRISDKPPRTTITPRTGNFPGERHNNYDSVIRQYLSPAQASIILTRTTEILRSIEAKAIPDCTDPYECWLFYKCEAESWPTRASAAFSTALEEMNSVFARDQIFDILGMVLDEDVFTLKNLEVLGNILQKAKTYIVLSKIGNFVEKLVAARGTTRKYVLAFAYAALERKPDPDTFVEMLTKVEVRAQKRIEEQTNPAIPRENQAECLNARLESLWRNVDPHFYAEAIRANLTSEEIANLLVEIESRCFLAARGAFRALPALLRAEIAPQAIVDILSKVEREADIHRDKVFDALARALDSAEQNLSSDQINEFVNNILSKARIGAKNFF